jgi:hypothetical protein
MEHKIDVQNMDKKIQLLKEISEDILKEAENFPSLYRNCRRILANIKMLELNVSDINDYC